MARLLYGGSPADFTTDDDGRIVPNAELTVWTAREGGTQLIDLLTVDEDAVTTVESDDNGHVIFYGPDNVDYSLWLDSGEGPRLLIRTIQLVGPVDEVTTSTIQDGAVTPAKLAAAADGQVLIFDGTAWVARDTTATPTYDDLAAGRVITA